jgi:hypothetical protein
MWTSWPAAATCPAPRPVLFFAPAQVKKRSAEWGPAEFGQRLVAAWHGFRQPCQRPGIALAGGAVAPRSGRGAGRHAHAGQVLDPRSGHLLSLTDA